MRRHVPIHMKGYSTRQEIRINRLIDPEFQIDEHSVYHAVNCYDDGFSGQKIELYAFKIERETECFYVLKNGTRVAKTMRNRQWSLTPEDAVRKALVRAENYLNILVRRGHTVSQFLRTARNTYPAKTQELYDFARDAKAMLDMDPTATPTEDDFI